MKKLLRKLKRLLSRSAVELQKRPLMCVQRPTNQDDSVMLNSLDKRFYMDPRIEPND